MPINFTLPTQGPEQGQALSQSACESPTGCRPQHLGCQPAQVRSPALPQPGVRLLRRDLCWTCSARTHTPRGAK